MLVHISRIILYILFLYTHQKFVLYNENLRTMLQKQLKAILNLDVADHIGFSGGALY